ncbi:hypothetical protein PybrP1_002968 [[Pythium] brassicae (nom. inval.)]|nr:hypothetical protein PybrP1_002968 [[Pythium] brassicae (nom. inval.)]
MRATCDLRPATPEQEQERSADAALALALPLPLGVAGAAQRPLAHTASYSSSADERRRRHRHERKKSDRKKRSKSARKKESKKDAKKSKKKKKKQKTERKKSKSAASKSAVDQNEYGKYGILRESDFHAKNLSFQAWLRDVKKMGEFNGPKWEAMELFKEYMEDYNTATMPHEKYYDIEKYEMHAHQQKLLKANRKSDKQQQQRDAVADEERVRLERQRAREKKEQEDFRLVMQYMDKDKIEDMRRQEELRAQMRMHYKSGNVAEARRLEQMLNKVDEVKQDWEREHAGLDGSEGGSGDAPRTALQLGVRGYACQVFDDAHTAWALHCERHLIPWRAASDLRLDRFDARNLLDDHALFRRLKRPRAAASANSSARSVDNKLHALRYGDYTVEYPPPPPPDPEVAADNPFAYAYPEDRDEDEDDEGGGEAYEPLWVIPDGIERLCAQPQSKKLHEVIAATAKKARENPQLEVMLKVKLSSSVRFGFLDPTHGFHAYYAFLRDENPPARPVGASLSAAKRRRAVALLGDEYGDDSDDDGNEEGGAEVRSAAEASTQQAVDEKKAMRLKRAKLLAGHFQRAALKRVSASPNASSGNGGEVTSGRR